MSLEIFNIIGVAAGASASALSVLIKALITDRAKKAGLPFYANEAQWMPAEDPLQPALDRLDEAESALRRQQSLARANRWMSRLLTIGQYIVGGLLASSFIQQSLSREVVGALGLLVLISSLIYQHFRPDIQLRGALGRSLRLSSLIRQAHDDIYAMRAGSANAPTIDAFRRKISSALSEIEASEFQDVAARSGEDSQNKHG